MLETDAFVSYKNGDNKTNEHPSLDGTHMLNLAQLIDEEAEGNEVPLHADEGHIVTTKDIDNYFNLQITTKLYIGSE